MKFRNKQNKISSRVAFVRSIVFSKQGINKRDLRANGFSILPLALRPLLLFTKKSSWKRTPKFIHTNLSVALSIISAMLGVFLFQNSYVNSVSASSLTLTIPSGISLTVTPETNAKFSKSSASTLSVKSDANFGYTLSIKSKTSDNNLVNGSSKITSISSAVSESDFSSKGTNNTWGYLPSKLNSSDNTNYQPGPTTTNTTIDKTAAANADKNDYSITLGTKTDNTLVAGTYKNTFVFTASANTVSYKITYNLESGSWTGTSPETGSTIEPSVKLSTITPTKSNYTFEGWCDTTVTSNNSTNPTCSGTKYSAGGTYTLSNGTNDLNLYAMWKSTARSYTINYNSNISGASNMPSAQTGSVTSPYSVTLRDNTPTLSGYTFKGWCSSTTNNATCSGTTYQPSASVTITSDGQTINLYAMWASASMQDFSCNLASGSSTTITDSRDGNKYTIAKLKDGKCWMTQNLTIGSNTSTTVLNSTNTDIPSGSYTLPQGSTSGFSIYNVAYMYVNGSNAWYSWVAATAGQNPSSGDVTQSICPKGWRLPTYNEFNNLISKQGSTKLMQSPANFTLDGFYNSGSLVNTTSGFYWSSTAEYNYRAYYLYVNSSGANTDSSGSKSYGFFVRCVSRQ